MEVKWRNDFIHEDFCTCYKKQGIKKVYKFHIHFCLLEKDEGYQSSGNYFLKSTFIAFMILLQVLLRGWIEQWLKVKGSKEQMLPSSRALHHVQK
jgi:hypothetical protein